jgi:hypothetical protein
MAVGQGVGRYKRVEENGIQFVFKYDDEAPELLHIYVRHLTSVDDALDVFFSPSPRNWNAERSRFETETETHGLYWFWIDKDKVVMVVSCFKL